MAKKNYYGVKQGRKTGVFDNWAKTEEQVKGFKGAQYKGFTTKLEAYEYVGLPIEELKKELSGAIINPRAQLTSTNDNNKRTSSNSKKSRNLIEEYREKKDDKNRLQLVSSLSDEDKNILYSKMSKNEISHYKKIASDLMEKRFSAVVKNKEILDYLLLKPHKIDINELDSKYGHLDLSITIYTIKAIINVMGESAFSKDDGSSYFNKNSQKYYSICKQYWNNIWWDTDTGILSKEEIKKRQFSSYHKKCNKVKTISEILKYINLLGINDFEYGNFSKRYSIDELKKEYTKQKKKIEELKKITLEKEYKQKLLRESERGTYLELYRNIAKNKNIAKNIKPDDLKKIKEKALYTIENHYMHEYNKEFVLEAVNVLKNLIL